jgi:hypothetical protein
MSTMDDEKLNHARDEISTPTSDVSGSPAVLPQIIDKEAQHQAPKAPMMLKLFQNRRQKRRNGLLGSSLRSL